MTATTVILGCVCLTFLLIAAWMVKLDRDHARRWADTERRRNHP